jgi:hypothetical protein
VLVEKRTKKRLIHRVDGEACPGTREDLDEANACVAKEPPGAMLGLKL